MSLRGRENNPVGGNTLSGSGYVRGVYALHPAMTPKYHTGFSAAGQNDKSLEKMARMFITFPPEPSTLRQNFLGSVGTQAHQFAKALATTGDVKSGGMGYIDFFLSQAQETMAETAQVVQVLSDNYVSYFYGRKPPVFRYDGVLLNSVQDDWRTAMWLIYNYIARGTQLARRKVAISLAYDTVMVTGVILDMTEVLRAENELAVPFSFSMLVKRFDIIKKPLYGPTPARAFPYPITPDTFASTVVEPARVSRRNVQEPGLVNSVRPGAETPEVPGVLVDPTKQNTKKDFYNTVTAEDVSHAAGSAAGVVYGVFSVSFTSAEIDRAMEVMGKSTPII